MGAQNGQHFVCTCRHDGSPCRGGCYCQLSTSGAADLQRTIFHQPWKVGKRPKDAIGILFTLPPIDEACLGAGQKCVILFFEGPPLFPKGNLFFGVKGEPKGKATRLPKSKSAFGAGTTSDFARRRKTADSVPASETYEVGSGVWRCRFVFAWFLIWELLLGWLFEGEAKGEPHTK